MSVEKEGSRNKLFIKLWKDEGLGNRALAERLNISISGVKSLKGRLRKKYPELYAASKSISKETKEQVDKSTSLQIEKKRKISFYFNPALVQKIKIEAVKRSVSASELVEGWLNRVVEKS